MYIPKYEDYRKQHKKLYPYGQYIYDETCLKDLRNYIGMEKATKTINTIHFIFGKNIDTLVRTVRKWYEKTNWQFCLSDKSAEKLIILYAKD